MRRVYGIWFLRQITPTLLVMPIFLTAALWLAAKEFFVVKIIENFTVSLHSADIFASPRFVATALLNTHHKALAIIGILTGISLFLAYRLVRNFTQVNLVKI